MDSTEIDKSAKCKAYCCITCICAAAAFRFKRAQPYTKAPVDQTIFIFALTRIILNKKHAPISRIEAFFTIF